MCVNKIFWGTCGRHVRARLPTCALTYVRYVRAYLRAPVLTCARPNKWRTRMDSQESKERILAESLRIRQEASHMCMYICVHTHYVQNTHVYFVLMCVRVNVSWRFCKWSGIAFVPMGTCASACAVRADASEIRRNPSGFFDGIRTRVICRCTHT